MFKLFSSSGGGDLPLAITAVIATIISTINLVVGGSQRARLHSDLARRWCVLEREIVAAPSPSEEQGRQFTIRRLEIEQDEPPILRVVDVMCHNELVKAMGHGKDQMYKIPWWLQITGHFVNWWEDAIPEVPGTKEKVGSTPTA